jgi:O-antigen/teichoic acid export membrane protein
VLIAVGAPVGLGQRILAGLGRNHVSIAVMGLQTPLVLLALVLLLAWGVPAGGAVALLAYGAALLLSLVCAVIAGRLLGPALRTALRQVPRLRTVRGARVFDVAWPMLVIMVAVPLAMQSDRVVLSHRGGSDVLVEYNLAAQMFVPIWAVVSAGGMALWPVFARARARGSTDSPLPMVWAFGGFAAVMATGVALLSPFLADLASGGRVQLGMQLVVGFAVLMVLQGLKYPLGVYLTDPAGLRFQALAIALMLPVKLALSWVLADRLGAAGPVIGSIVAVSCFELAANALYVRHRRRTGGPGAPGPSTPIDDASVVSTGADSGAVPR